MLIKLNIFSWSFNKISEGEKILLFSFSSFNILNVFDSSSYFATGKWFFSKEKSNLYLKIASWKNWLKFSPKTSKNKIRQFKSSDK